MATVLNLNRSTLTDLHDLDNKLTVNRIHQTTLTGSFLFPNNVNIRRLTDCPD